MARYSLRSGLKQLDCKHCEKVIAYHGPESGRNYLTLTDDKSELCFPCLFADKTLTEAVEEIDKNQHLLNRNGIRGEESFDVQELIKDTRDLILQKEQKHSEKVQSFEEEEDDEEDPRNILLLIKPENSQDKYQVPEVEPSEQDDQVLGVEDPHSTPEAGNPQKAEPSTQDGFSIQEPSYEGALPACSQATVEEYGSSPFASQESGLVPEAILAHDNTGIDQALGKIRQERDRVHGKITRRSTYMCRFHEEQGRLLEIERRLNEEERRLLALSNHP